MCKGAWERNCCVGRRKEQPGCKKGREERKDAQWGSGAVGHRMRSGAVERNYKKIWLIVVWVVKSNLDVRNFQKFQKVTRRATVAREEKGCAAVQWREYYQKNWLIVVWLLVWEERRATRM